MTNTNRGRPGNRPDVETLRLEKDYRKILELEFSEMIPFVLSNIRKPGMVPLFYMSINMIFLVFIIVLSVWSGRSGTLRTANIFWQLLAGVLAGSFLIIPPHEILHGLSYRLLGARRIRFGADFQQFIFYVSADRFPISKKELYFLALSPFAVINIVAITLTAAWAQHLALFSSSLLFFHNIMCIGDFAVVNYALQHSGELYTFDDIEKRMSYFFAVEKKV